MMFIYSAMVVKSCRWHLRCIPLSESCFFLLQSNVENMSPQIIRQVTKELLDLQKNPPEGIRVFMNEEDITDIHATIEGPGNFCLINTRFFSYVNYNYLIH